MTRTELTLYIHVPARSLIYIGYIVHSCQCQVTNPQPPAVNENNEFSTRLVIQENTDSSRFRWVSAPHRRRWLQAGLVCGMVFCWHAAEELNLVQQGFTGD